MFCCSWTTYLEQLTCQSARQGCQLHRIQKTTENIHVSDGLRRIVTFLIDALYKYSYLLTYLLFWLLRLINTLTYLLTYLLTYCIKPITSGARLCTPRVSPRRKHKFYGGGNMWHRWWRPLRGGSVRRQTNKRTNKQVDITIAYSPRFSFKLANQHLK